MKKILVLGCGRVGRTICLDLALENNITVADISDENLKKVNRKNITTIKFDVSNNKKLRKLIQGFNLVISCVPGFMGFKTLKTIIEERIDVVDISFFPEDALELSKLAKEKNVTAIVDAGVAPGLSNLILGYYDSLYKVNYYACYVGGLPKIKNLPFEYKAPFSPIDVIEEYIRPARYVQHSQLITKEALSDTELIEFDEIGTLESWNSDGLRSLIDTMPNIPNMIEKTLRYPGCVEYLKVLRASGFFSYEEIDLNGHKVRPIDLTAKLLFPKWKMDEDDRDFTVMRIIIKGKENGKEKAYRYDLLDRFQNKTMSMARTTGYTCTAVTNLVLNGTYNRIGISPPEYLGAHKEFVSEYLAERGVNYKMTEI